MALLALLSASPARADSFIARWWRAVTESTSRPQPEVPAYTAEERQARAEAVWKTGMKPLERNSEGYEVFLREADGKRVVRIPGGVFRMGIPPDERPPEGSFAENALPGHFVGLGAFALDETEVTWDRYRRFARTREFKPPRRRKWAGGDHPIVYINWFEAAAYCDWVGGRLPSEAEWEYPAGGAQGNRYVWGDEWPPPEGAGNLPDATGYREQFRGRKVPAPLRVYDDGVHRTAPIGAFPRDRSPFGVLDMAGNVSEWVGDWYGSYPDAPTEDQAIDNPTGPRDGSARVLRGRSWYPGGYERAGAYERKLRIYHRRMDSPDWTDGIGGFRCAMDLPPGGEPGSDAGDPG